MLLAVKVIPNASKPRILEEQGLLKVYVKSPPVDGKANKELVEALAKHFKIKKNRIEIVRGETSRKKSVKIIDSAS
jgi:uncharacterized protein